jgi:hypothetical protein
MAGAYARVFIWLPKGIDYALGIGHGGLKIKTAEGNKYYITWLNGKAGGSSGSAGSGGGFTSQSREASRRVGFAVIKDRDGQIVPNPNALGSGQTFGFKDDRKANVFRFPELQGLVNEMPPNYALDLPVADPSFATPDATPFGVNVRRIERYWKSLLALPPGHRDRRFGALSKRHNCNGVVVEALLVGGLWMYADPPENLIYQDARTLLRWVEKAKARIDAMNRHYQDLSQDLLGLPPLADEDRQIPSLKEWKQDSEKNVRFYARRIDQVARLDELIPVYHKARRAGNNHKALNTLLRMQWQIYEHLATKPRSDRRQAVLRLAQRVLAVLHDGFVAEFEEDQVVPVVPLNGHRSDNDVVPIET